MNAKQEFLAYLDGEIAKYEDSAKGWQELRDHGNYPDQSNDLINKSRNYANELRALRQQVIDEV
jgi:hypothetical protein